MGKRLTAFTALSVVSSMMAGAAVDQFFPLMEEIDKDEGQGLKHAILVAMQLVGFSLMCIVLFLNVLATMVFGVQFYFTFRLMTAGAIGFESAKAFYLEPRLTYWRHISAKSLLFGLPLFLVSVGCMLFVEFDNRRFPIRAWVTFISFSTVAALLLRIGLLHAQLFSRKYYKSSAVRPLLEVVNESSAPPGPATFWSSLG